jgi:hypothetical protein
MFIRFVYVGFIILWNTFVLFYMNSCSCCIGFIGGYFEFSVIALEGRNRHFPRSSKVFFVVTMGKVLIYIYIYIYITRTT